MVAAQDDGLRCDFMSKTCKSLGASGASCNFDSDCLAANACVVDPTTHQGACAPRLAAGSPCMPSQNGGDPCDAMSHCDMASGMCAARVADGQPCMVSSQCSSGTCVNMLCGSGGGGGVLDFVCK